MEEEESPEIRTRLINQAIESGGSCPHDGAELEYESMHERDSTYDRNYCPKCGWGYSNIETWNLGR